jgi:hypothetical protein
MHWIVSYKSRPILSNASNLQNGKGSVLSIYQNYIKTLTKINIQKKKKTSKQHLTSKA